MLSVAVKQAVQNQESDLVFEVKFVVTLWQLTTLVVGLVGVVALFVRVGLPTLPGKPKTTVRQCSITHVSESQTQSL